MNMMAVAVVLDFEVVTDELFDGLVEEAVAGEAMVWPPVWFGWRNLLQR